MEGRSRSNETPPGDFADPVAKTAGSGFCPNTPISELIGHVVRATKANDAAPIPPNTKKHGQNERYKTSQSESSKRSTPATIGGQTSLRGW